MSDADFAAALAAKVAAPDEGTTAVAEVTEAPESTESTESTEATEATEATETTEGEQPRDEQGRFVAKERPEWLPPQFKSEEDFARSYGELQSVLGRQGQELGELRKIAEQISERTPQPQNFGQLQGALEENPEAVAYWAAQQGNEQMLEQALAAWNQRALDEGDAVSLRNAQRFERDIELAKLKYEFSQEVTPSIEQVQREAGVRALALARRELSAKYPDFDQVMESITESDVEGLDPQVIGQLQKTDPKAALETVYRWAVVGRSSTAAASEAHADEAEKEAALQRKREAAVATSSSAPARGEKSAKEALKDFMLTPEPHSVHHGLTE